MPGAINLNTNINTANNYTEEAIQNELRQTEEIEKTERQSPLQNPTTDLAKTAQTSTDIVLANGGINLNQIVIAETAPRKEEIGQDDTQLNKAVSGLSTQSITGATAEENALPPEVQTRNDIE